MLSSSHGVPRCRRAGWACPLSLPAGGRRVSEVKGGLQGDAPKKSKIAGAQWLRPVHQGWPRTWHVAAQRRLGLHRRACRHPGHPHQARELGINFFDTAQAYGFGASERLLGLALRGELRHRHEDVVAAGVAGHQQPRGVRVLPLPGAGTPGCVATTLAAARTKAATAVEREYCGQATDSVAGSRSSTRR